MSVPPSLQVANDVIEALISSGTTEFAYCPGSRNAPFAYVLAAQEAAGRVRVHAFAEERGAAFWALGAAQALGGRTPVAVVTTSGTAAAELHPPLEEARHQGLPVVAVTADRPFQMVGVGASQATGQNGMFASTVCVGLDVPEGADSAGVRNRVWRAVARGCGMGGRSGPVHLNVAFADPLVPPDYEAFASSVLEGTDGTERRNNPAIGALRQSVQTKSAPRWEDTVQPGLSTIVVAGSVDPGDLPSARELAKKAAEHLIPVIAEPASGICDCATWIPHAPWVIEMCGAGVEQVVVLGKPTLSRQVMRLLQRPEIRVVVLANHHEWTDIWGNAEVVLPLDGSFEFTEDTLGNRQPREHDGQLWLERWMDAAHRIDRVLDEHITLRGLDHIAVSQQIWSQVEGIDLWLGASNAVRGFDVAAREPGRANVFANRGLAGIDGSIASALGVQAMRGRPMRAVIGDLTFCYDLPTLAARPHHRSDVQVVVLDDGGGSIFASLEHGTAPDDIYEKYFAVPQTIDIAAAARACGWEATTVTTLEELRASLEVAIVGRSVIHVVLERPGGVFAALRERVVG